MHEPCTVEELSHTAEIGLRVRASSIEALYGCAATAMFAMLDAGPDLSGRALTQTLTVSAPDLESLLVDWLNQLLFLHETTGACWLEAQVAEVAERDGAISLHATVRGWRTGQSPRMQIKAVTYHQLRVGAEDGGWRAEVFFDI